MVNKIQQKNENSANIVKVDAIKISQASSISQ